MICHDLFRTWPSTEEPAVLYASNDFCVAEPPLYAMPFLSGHDVSLTEITYKISGAEEAVGVRLKWCFLFLDCNFELGEKVQAPMLSTWWDSAGSRSVVRL